MASKLYLIIYILKIMTTSSIQRCDAQTPCRISLKSLSTSLSSAVFSDPQKYSRILGSTERQLTNLNLNGSKRCFQCCQCLRKVFVPGIVLYMIFNQSDSSGWGIRSYSTGPLSHDNLPASSTPIPTSDHNLKCQPSLPPIILG